MTETHSPGLPRDLLAGLPGLLPDLETLYTDLHQHPELSGSETRTAARMAEWLAGAGADVTPGVGGTGVVGVLRNGDGPTVMLRADMDALPVRETSGLPYASEVTMPGPEGEHTPVAHVCGHDMHLAWLAGVTSLLHRNRADWSGTVLAVCQPAEETGAGAEGMIADGFAARFPRPDVILGQHVARAPTGFVGTRPGVLMAASDALRVRMFGRGGHGAMPELSVDPIVMAAATVLRLQTIVSRETAASASAVVTVGTLKAGTKENVIAEEAVLGLSVRTLDDELRTRTLAAIQRIVEAEAQASGAPRPPEIALRRGRTGSTDGGRQQLIRSGLRRPRGTAFAVQLSRDDRPVVQQDELVADQHRVGGPGLPGKSDEQLSGPLTRRLGHRGRRCVGR